jgi:HlyD family secretion protein
VKTKLFLRTILVAATIVAASCQPNSSPSSFSGTIEVDEARIGPRYGGRVIELCAHEGDELQPGQIVAVLEAPELSARRDMIAAQLAELEAGPRPGEIAAAKSDWEAQVAQLDLSRIEAKRAEDLFAQSAISTTERDRARAQLDTLEKSAASAKNRYNLLVIGTRPERITAARAQLAEIEAQLAELQVTAPTNCVLESLSVKVGDVVAPNREVAALLLTDHLWVRVFVPEPMLGHVKLGQSATIRVDAFPGRDFTGAIEQIARAAEFTPRNVQTTEERVQQVFGVKIRLDNQSNDLRAGMAADVIFNRGSK